MTNKLTIAIILVSISINTIKINAVERYSPDLSSESYLIDNEPVNLQHIKYLKLVATGVGGPGYIYVFEDSMGKLYHIYSHNANTVKVDKNEREPLLVNRSYWVALHGFLNETYGSTIKMHPDALIPQHILYKDDKYIVSAPFDGDCFYASNIKGHYIYPLSYQDSLPMFDSNRGTAFEVDANSLSYNHFNSEVVKATKSNIKNVEKCSWIDSVEYSNIKSLRLKDLWKVNDWMVLTFADENCKYYAATRDTLPLSPVPNAEPLEIGRQYLINISPDFVILGPPASQALETSGEIKINPKKTEDVKLRDYKITISRPRNNQGIPNNIIGRWVIPIKSY